MKIFPAVITAGLLLSVASVLPAAAQTATGVQAEIVDFDFSPRELRVAVGTQVTWANGGTRPHTVTDRGGTFDHVVSPGEEADVTFSVPGRYYFFCRINPGRMNGTIVVEPGDQPARVQRIQATDPARAGDTLRFDPNSLTVPTGTTIVLANVGGKPHTLTAEDGLFDTGVVTPGPEGGRFAGTNATITLTTPGTFPFRCDVHSAIMRGVLTVVGEAREAPAPPSGAPTTAGVTIRDFEFDPLEISVAPGGKVTWTNDGNAPHTATFDDVELDTGRLEGGGSSTLTAPVEPGSYSYKCSVHPARMQAVLVVVGQNAEDPVEVAAEPPPQPSGDRGGAPLSAAVLGTGVLGAFLGGLGVASFGRRRPAPPTPAPPPGQQATTEEPAAEEREPPD